MTVNDSKDVESCKGVPFLSENAEGKSSPY